MSKAERINAIIRRLADMGVRTEFPNESCERTQVDIDFEDKLDSEWIEIGFLLGQWSSMAGIEFPRDFPRNEMPGFIAFRMDVDPGRMRFIFDAQ